MLATLFSPAFPLHEKVLLKECPKDVGPGEGAPVEVVEETATRLRFRTQRSTPGWVVVLQTFFPGWHATVNGTPAVSALETMDQVAEIRPGSIIPVEVMRNDKKLTLHVTIQEYPATN